MTYYNLHIEGDAGDPVELVWNEHQNANVSKYEIWRKVKYQVGGMGDPELLATKNRGTTSYTDYDYSITSGYTDDLLYYDVRAYYSIEGTYADPDWLDCFGEQFAKPVAEGSENDNDNLPAEFELTAFPNPFNPTTTIYYNLIETSYITLTISDIRGRQLITLVDKVQHPGNHFAQWHGKDSKNSLLPSGMYFFQFTAIANNQNVHYKTGKLLLLK